MSKTPLDETYEVAPDKDKIIITLLRAGMKPNEIVDLKPSDITEKGIKKVEVQFDLLKGYVGSNGRKIKAQGFLFPGQKQGGMKASNIPLSIGKAAKKAGYKLDDLGLGIQRQGPVKQKIEFKSPKDLIAWLSEK